jgi:pyridoxine kinase
MRLLSIQSQVAYGHVGNSAATFPLQRLGVDVLPVSTVVFSNHTGYGAWRGMRLAPADVADVILGIEERGVFPTIDVVLSGYLGSAGVAEVVADTVRRVKAANPAAIFSCDPVMGNATAGRFVAEDIPELVRRILLPQADVITPNQFELGLLTDTTPTTLESLLEAVDLALASGPSTVLVTSVTRQDADPRSIEMLVANASGAWLVRTPRLPGKLDGTGDVTAALFTAHLRDTGNAALALARTASSVFDLIDTTHRSGERELQLIQAQEFYATPRLQFTAEQVR